MNDTEKLALILEHANEYYVNGREYKFFEGGFVSYEFFGEDDLKSVYIADIFVSKASRGTGVFNRIISFCLCMEHTHGVKFAYCQIEKANEHIDTLQAMYKSVGFREYNDDGANIYYKLDV